MNTPYLKSSLPILLPLIYPVPPNQILFTITLCRPHLAHHVDDSSLPIAEVFKMQMSIPQLRDQLFFFFKLSEFISKDIHGFIKVLFNFHNNNNSSYYLCNTMYQVLFILSTFYLLSHPSSQQPYKVSLLTSLFFGSRN